MLHKGQRAFSNHSLMVYYLEVQYLKNLRVKQTVVLMSYPKIINNKTYSVQYTTALSTLDFAENGSFTNKKGMEKLI